MALTGFFRHRGGYTLTEVLLTTAILGVVALTAPPAITQMIRFFHLTQARNDIQRDARVCLDLINRNLRQASAATVVVGRLSGQPFYSRVQFTKADGTAMSFYQQGQNLFMISGSSTTQLSENVQYLAFTYPDTTDDNIISVSTTLEKETYQGGAKALQLSIEKVRIMND